jgi:hypothetical protein
MSRLKRARFQARIAGHKPTIFFKLTAISVDAGTNEREAVRRLGMQR